jgi:hypothetical protein
MRAGLRQRFRIGEFVSIGKPAFENIEARALTWSQELKSCAFAGQIDLSEHDLRTLSPSVTKGLESRVATAHDHAVRVVFSVNCAYYADDGGFWDYFCKHTDYEDTAQNQSWLGQKIEESLLHFGFMDKPGYGSYRWVGPLLAQAGVTLRSMPKFAAILLEAADGEWERFPSVTFYSFRYVVDHFGPGSYLGLFLKDDTQVGWRFACDVARSIHQLETNLISWTELRELPGYRPGFWNELKRHLEIRTAACPVIRPKGAPSPKLVFNDATQQVQLLFAHDWVERRVYVFDGTVVENPIIPLSTREDFQRSYTVLIKDEAGASEECKVPGWTPDGPDPVAIFHPQRGYIPPDTPLPPGQYYFLSPQGTHPPDSVSILTDFEHVAIADATYHYWLIELANNSNLENSGYKQRRIAPDLLCWDHQGARLFGSLDGTDIFVEQLPPIRVNQATLFRQNHLALFVSTGSQRERLKLNGTAEPEEINLPLDAPCSGHIWVEPLGRLREADSPSAQQRLTFALLPKCALRWPFGLFTPADQPLITFDGPGECHLSFPDCVPAKPGAWKVPAGASFVEGTLHAAAVSLLVGCNIYRAEFSHDTDPRRRFFETADFDTEFQIRMRGLPGMAIRLAVSNSHYTLPLDLPQYFDAAGRKRINSLSVRDSLKNYPEAAGAISIWSGSAWVHSGATLINLAELSSWLFVATAGNTTPTWLELLDRTFSVWLSEAVQALLSKTFVQSIQCLPSLSPHTQKWADAIELMLLIFAEPIPENPFLDKQLGHLDTGMTKALRWVWSARVLVERGTCEEASDATTLINEYPSWIAPYPPWRKIMEDLLRHLRQQQDLDQIVAEWAAEARPPMRLTLMSRIGKQERGRDLSEAYICSQRKDLPGAYLLADNIQRATASGLVLDLAMLLKNIVCVTSKLPFQPPTTKVHSKLQPYFDGLSRLSRGEAALNLSGVKTLDPQHLPLHADDIALLRKAIGI